jgi:hypothetical protein
MPNALVHERDGSQPARLYSTRGVLLWIGYIAVLDESPRVHYGEPCLRISIHCSCFPIIAVMVFDVYDLKAIRGLLGLCIDPFFPQGIVCYHVLYKNENFIVAPCIAVAQKMAD